MSALDLSVLVRMLSSSHQPTRCAALLLLLELSKSQLLCEKIGSINGAILVLVTNKYNYTDCFASEKAEKILRNLESHPINIKHMAENGHVEPLLNHLIEGIMLQNINHFSYSLLTNCQNRKFLDWINDGD